MNNREKWRIAGNKQIILLLISMIMYALGGGIAHYLGTIFKPLEFILGLIWIISIHIAGYLMILYFIPQRGRNEEDLRFEWLKMNKVVVFQSGAFFLTACGIVVVTLVLTHKLNIFSSIIFVLTVISLVLAAVPPFCLAEKGYLEILLAIFQGCLIPATGFFLMLSTYHNLLGLITFPITCIGLAFFLAINFSTLASDMTTGRKSFLRLITWQKAIPIHHLLLVFPYILFGIEILRGFPFNLIGPVFLTIPFAIFQIYFLNKISLGGKPIWPLLNGLAATVYSFSAYLLAFSFWTR
jgi:1,4-dihydroxy-2-naphthoate octaprenyltransferase